MLRAVLIVALCLFAVPALAGEPDLETPKDVAKALKKGYRKSDNNLIGAAIGRARELKKTHEAEDLAPIVAALEPALESSDSQRQWVALGLIDDLAVPGSYEYFRHLLDVPKRLTGTGTRNARSRAISVAARVGGEEALPDILKLLKHRDVKFSRSAARALAHYTTLEQDKKSDLVQKLIGALATAEKETGKRDADVAARAKGMIEELNKTLAALTEKAGPSTSKAWLAALAEE